MDQEYTENDNSLNSVNSPKIGKPVSAIERCLELLRNQNELLNVLRKRLDPVVMSEPQDGVDAPEQSLHIGTVANTIQSNNEKINQLLNQLVI